jgi:protease-4
MTEPTENPMPEPQQPPQYQAPQSWPEAWPQQPKKRRTWMWIGVGAAVFVLFVGAMFFAAWKLTTDGSGDGTLADGSAFGGGKIGVIDVDGVIMSAEQTEADLQKFEDDDSIKAIVLHINSPGGGAAASQEIYSELMRLRHDHKKPIVSSVETVGASGAYYIASATDRIYANGASVVGSIGVIAEWVNYGGLMQWAKLKPVTMQAGRLKSAGTPTRDPTPEETAYMQALIDNMYGQFVHDVSVARNIPEPELKELATGQVWTGAEAIPLHLIDREGTFRDCLRDTARQVGIKGDSKRRIQSAGREPRLLLPVEIGWLLNPAYLVTSTGAKRSGEICGCRVSEP